MTDLDRVLLSVVLLALALIITLAPTFHFRILRKWKRKRLARRYPGLAHRISLSAYR